MVKTFVKNIFKVFGFEIKKSSSSLSRFSQEGCISNLKEIGFNPDTIIDGGGAYGEFSLMASNYYPDSYFCIFEPLVEYKKVLEKNTFHLNRKIFYNALSDKKETLEINVHEDLVGTSLFEENEEENNGQKRKIETVVLSEVLNENESILIKLDLQGAEIIALKGGLNKLKISKNIVIMCESSLFQFYKADKTKIFDLIKFFNEINYELYDVYGPSYRPNDKAMAQIDLVFMHKENDLKRSNIYADKEKRKIHNDRYKTRHKTMGIS